MGASGSQADSVVFSNHTLKFRNPFQTDQAGKFALSLLRRQNIRPPVIDHGAGHLFQLRPDFAQALGEHRMIHCLLSPSDCKDAERMASTIFV